MKNILFVTSEALPFIKTGGLADVAHALPKQLQKKDSVDIRVILPLYDKIKNEYGEKLQFIESFSVSLNWRHIHVGLFKFDYNGVIYYFIDNEFYFHRGEIYNHYSNEDRGEKYTYFNKAVLESLQFMDFNPKILHLNDWHTAMIPLIYKRFYKNIDLYKELSFVLTIHNLKYQGVFEKSIVLDLLEIPESSDMFSAVEFYGGINFMKAGITYADKLVTVSKTYADEIKLPYYGEKLDGLLKENEEKLVGIVNGIDYDENNPETDKLIDYNYSVENVIEIKKKNKLSLQKSMGLIEDPNIPIIGMVSRLQEMKGFDIVRHIFEEFINYDVQFILLGTGNKEIEESFRYFENKYPSKVRANIMFSNELAHKIYSSADIYLMPSKFEPCGLSQLIALRYGTIPIVRETGGLNDTIKPYNIYKDTGNGFSFRNYNAHELLFAIQRSLSLYNDKQRWGDIIKRAMKSDNSWEKSAEEYLKIYNELL